MLFVDRARCVAIDRRYTPPEVTRRDPVNWLLPLTLGVGVVIAGGVLVAMNLNRVRASDSTVELAHVPRPVDRSSPPAPRPSTPSDIRDSIHVSHLLVMHRGSRRAPSTIVRTAAAARARADQAVNSLLSGRDFPAVAAEFSDEPGAAARRGDLGRIQPGQTVASFEAAAFALQPGQASGVVETEFGFHVIYRWPE